MVFYIQYLIAMKSIPRAIELNSDELVTDGIFNINRNPQSLARVIGLIGLGIMGCSVFTLLLAIIWIIINHFNILLEEKYLEEKFGEYYRKYFSITPRYLKIVKNNRNCN